MMGLDWIDLDSEAVAAAAFDAENEFIYVRFTSGSTYLYEACPPHVWEEFMAPGQSAGKYVDKTLRHKPYKKLDI